MTSWSPQLLLLVAGGGLLGLWFAWGIYHRVRRWWRFNKYRIKDQGPRFFATRRNAMKLGGAFVLTGLGLHYWPTVRSELPSAEAIRNGSVNWNATGRGTPSAEDLYTQTFNSRIVERIEFSEDGTMAVTLADTHGADAFGIWHATDDDSKRDPVASYGMSITSDPLPRYGGTVGLNISNKLADSGADFPSNRFKLIAVTGFWIWEPVGQVRFRVPPDLMP